MHFELLFIKLFPWRVTCKKYVKFTFHIRKSLDYPPNHCWTNTMCLFAVKKKIAGKHFTLECHHCSWEIKASIHIEYPEHTALLNQWHSMAFYLILFYRAWCLQSLIFTEYFLVLEIILGTWINPSWKSGKSQCLGLFTCAV